MSGLLKRARLQGLLALAMWVGGPAEAADPLYVQAPRLALREQPGLDGRVLDHLVTNTRVQRLSIEGSWCKVQTSLHQGFVDCRDLANRPIQLQTVVAQLQNVVASLDEGQITQFEWLDLLQKKFWIQPALGSLYDYGHALDRVYDGHKFDEDYEKSGLPSNGERLSEFSGRRGPYRPARPEFEAMKDYLRKTGFIVSPAPRELVAVKLEPAVRAVLPRIKPSFLGRQPVPLLVDVMPFVREKSGLLIAMSPAGQSLSDLLFAGYKLRVEAYGPRQGQHYGGYEGAWDIGGALVSLPASGLRYVALDWSGDVFLEGRIAALDTRYVRPGIGCLQEEDLVLADPVPKIQRAPVWLIGPQVHGLKAVKLLGSKSLAPGSAAAQTLRKDLPDLDEQASVERGPGRMVSFDLNGDGIADLAVLSVPVLGKGHIPAGGEVLRVYQNLRGQWRLTATSVPEVCGC